jgi:drug/metabolite transporter (DMT)-like permease
MLAATVTYNVSLILLAIAAREESTTQDRKSLTAHVAEGTLGEWSIALGVLGWVFELIAFTQISVTLARVIYAAGFGVMLVLARWRLGEQLQRMEAIGIIAIGLGIVAVGTTSPSVSRTTPGLFGWLILTVVIIPTIFLPDIVQRVQNSPAAYISGIGAGLGYAASNLYTKGVSDELALTSLLPLALLGIAAAVTSIVAFMDQIKALQSGRATAIVPLVAGLQSVIPIIIASLFFGERWPASLDGRILLGGGIALTTIGMVVLAYSSAQIVHSSSASSETAEPRPQQEKSAA